MIGLHLNLYPVLLFIGLNTFSDLEWLADCLHVAYLTFYFNDTTWASNDLQLKH